VYTNVVEAASGHSPGVFGLAHLWFDQDEAPLGRTRRALYAKRSGGDVDEVSSVRSLKIEPETEGQKLAESGEQYLTDREAIEEVVEDRIEEVEKGIIGTIYNEGDEYSVEQQKFISYFRHLKNNVSGELSEPIDGCTEVSEAVATLLDRVKEVKLKGTDEGRLMREQFRKEGKGLGDWDIEVLLSDLTEFLDENIEASTEYQSKLAGTGDVDARVLCWGVLQR